ncbi:NADP-dependent oxidoreductase domain-containing protein [Xylariaceae sp. FL0662B]|nr:NADP-dependent oxidoreductase domain-containing protein [Xylariaceae sp. FL0662B]
MAPKITSIAGKPVGPIGYGLMGMTLWNQIPYDDASKAMKAALDGGANFWNAGTFYGPPDANSLQLLKHYFGVHPSDASRVFLSLKGAYDINKAAPDCTPEGIRTSVDDALRVLDGRKSIDLFECARVDPNVPIETSVKTLAELIKEGKIGSYGLSEVNPKTIRRAHAVHPPAAVEVELSIFSRHALEKGGVIDTCRELGIPVVGYSPLDRGWLTGELKKYEDLGKDDYRHNFPRFQKGAFEQNVKLAEFVAEIAKAKGVTSPQVAIAWVKQQGALPIPGATKVNRVVENCKEVTLNDAEIADLQKKIDEIQIVGHRYPAFFHEHLEL